MNNEEAYIEVCKTLFILIKAAEKEMLSKNNKLVGTDTIKKILGVDATKIIDKFIENQVNAHLIPINYFEFWAILKANNYDMKEWNDYNFTSKGPVAELKTKYVNYLYNLLIKYNNNIKRITEQLNTNNTTVGGAKLTPYLIIALITFPRFVISLNDVQTSRVTKLLNDYSHDKKAGKNCMAYKNLEDVFPDANKPNNKIFALVKQNFKESELNDACGVTLKSLEASVGKDPRRAAGLIPYPEAIANSIAAVKATGMTIVSDALSEIMYHIYTDDNGDNKAFGIAKDGFVKLISGPLEKFAKSIATCPELAPQQASVLGWAYTSSSWLWDSKMNLEDLIISVDKAFSSSERQITNLLDKEDTRVMEGIFRATNWSKYKDMRTQAVSMMLFNLPRLQQKQMLKFIANLELDILKEMKLLKMDFENNIEIIYGNIAHSFDMTRERLNFAYDASLFAWEEGGHFKNAAGKLAKGDKDGAGIALKASAFVQALTSVKDLALIGATMFGANGIVVIPGIENAF
jgi:hypothetical protein